MIDVVVPVFAGLKETIRCIEAVLASRAGGEALFELVVIDDCTPDAGIKEYISSLQDKEGITLLANARNLGFVASANRGMSLHPDRDIVLLNSDAEVANNWLDRLWACAYRERDIGTVTPFSNNATICSFPVCCENNPLPKGMTVGKLDAAFAGTNAGLFLDMPTAVGFCMYVRRDCIVTVGPFDEQRFGRGYGEENDFCRRALKQGWRNVLAADVFVFHAGCVSFGAERDQLIRQADRTLAELHPEYFASVHEFVRKDPAAPLRQAVEIGLARAHLVSRHPVSYSGEAGTVRLHVMHDMGGGIERWLSDYCCTDRSGRNLILKPFYGSEMWIEGLMLFDNPAATQPLHLWRFAEPFDTSTVQHAEYARVIKEIVAGYHIGAVLVSSLIGHALDVLETGLPTIWVGHDYFPLCPSIHLHFGDVCQRCDDTLMTECAGINHDFNPFVGLSADVRTAIRRGFLKAITSGAVSLVAPSRAMWRHLITVFPQAIEANWVRIPHGDDTPLTPLPFAGEGVKGKLRILVLGQLSVSKGVRLLDEILNRMGSDVEFHLVGAQEMAELFLEFPQVKVVERYALDELRGIVANIRPHVGLLLSIWPETYSYTLTEMMRMGVTPVATRRGAFAERIIEGKTGFLVEPQADAIVGRLRLLDLDRSLLNATHAHLGELPGRSVADMVEDYRRLLPPTTAAAQVDRPSRQAERVAGQEPLIVTQRKLMKSLHLAAAMRAIRIERLRCAVDAAVARERELASRLSALEVSLRERDGVIGSQKAYVASLEAQLHEIFSSTVWRCLTPLHVLGRIRRRSDALKRGAWHVVRNPRSIPRYVKKAGKIFRSEGFAGVGRAMARIGAVVGEGEQDALLSYRRSFEQKVQPEMRDRISAMENRPLISIIVPTFNTPEHMLVEMLASVKAQLYPNWELCVADDGSDQPHVMRILEQHAAADKRIKLALGRCNEGVSHASNVALGLCEGDFVILLDHDDILETHALFRVAQSVCEDDPDMLYSDEVLVMEDGLRARQFVYRPAFSPEYLRGHPYIVHLVGFRKTLLREIGGFDERLRISQDYDLILRASEAARTIVHVPDLLYRWRIHGDSAGHQKMGQVMATSSEILRRHLERCGEVGMVDEGVGFNLFDIRYPLREGIRVAIVIPTRNHGDLLKQCIDSIRETVSGIRYDVVVIDHASDDAVTLAYLDSLGSAAKVFRYLGEFNFSAINNWAVDKLEGHYSHLLFCNNDIQAISPGWLKRMLEIGQREGNAIVGAKLYYPDRKTIQHAGVCVGAHGRAEHYGKFMRMPDDHLEPGYLGALVLNHEVSAVTAACMLVQTAAFRDLGGFDESIQVGFGDADLCLRAMEQGYRVVFCAMAELIHHESRTRGISHGDNHPEDTTKFLTKWQALLESGDPYYNPRLSLNDTDWSMVLPIPCSCDIKRRIFRKSSIPGMQSLSFSADGMA